MLFSICGSRCTCARVSATTYSYVYHNKIQNNYDILLAECIDIMHVDSQLELIISNQKSFCL